jgi:hypothetical protein
VVPSAHVLEVVEACGRKGVRALIVISAGFKEIGPEGAKREADLRAAVKKHGMRLIGPNCLGILNTDPTCGSTPRSLPWSLPMGASRFRRRAGRSASRSSPTRASSTSASRSS